MPQSRLKILLLDSGKEWGGGTNSMLELLKRIDRNTFDISCCFYNNYVRDKNESISEALAALDIPIFFIPQARQPAWAKLAKEALRTLLFFNKKIRLKCIFAIDKIWRINPNIQKINSLLEMGQYDILYMNNQPSSNFEGYYSTVGLPTTVIQHCRIEPLMNDQIVSMVNDLCHAIISVSDGVQKKLVQHGVNPRICHTVFNGIDVHQPLPDGRQLRQSFTADEDTFVFGSIGSLILRKSHHHILQALHLFNYAYPAARWKMVMVGAGPEHQALVKMAANYRILDNVIFTGFKSNAMEYLAAFDAFILASSSEGLPRVVLEAMLLNTPVIGSNVIGTAELIHHEETGLLFPYGDTQLLFRHFERLYLDKNYRLVLARNANEMVRTHFTIDKYVAGVEAVLGSIKRA
ncbi:glycosyltransferase [Biostraticola tofi]|uniref:Glycosyltransferase involved in cell wall biosynthesis n=1 Tax=Biostraticola tofi TaxID=466109 RepID=A0A4R3YR80_9GAMM|nr:glycosyltransferase [Biostraticola tofi]TCV93493.1 glycosyltransferase involved in cell wall biosynthesis [Biostraticola tofi]